jgi:hypothetical protein
MTTTTTPAGIIGQEPWRCSACSDVLDEYVKVHADHGDALYCAACHVALITRYSWRYPLPSGWERPRAA